MSDAVIEYRTAKELAPYVRNARKHSKAQIGQIVESIKRFRWTNPILIDEGGGIVAGHGRVAAAEVIYKKGGEIETVSGGQLPFGKVPVIVARGWSDEEKRAYVLADNKLALNAGWDEGLLRIELGDLKAIGFEISLIGFNQREVASYTGGDEADAYTRKLRPPVYEPSGAKVSAQECYDASKCEALKREIEGSGLDDEVVALLWRAAERHVVFDFHKIAEFYADADARTQRLMERSALVIVDFDAAIEGGFVTLNDRLGALADGGE